MAERTVLVCDFDDETCAQQVSRFRLWRDGDRQASAIDLCETHAEALNALFARAVPTDLPSKPRQRMEVTALKVTDKTQHLKKG